jgi:hypothetical protein
MKIKLNFAIISLLLTLVFSCTNEKGAEKALKDTGYHPIKVGGYGWFDCAEGDKYATRFEAYSHDSTRIITGCVCEGFFKGKTIRLD